jgi:hypothetical protein
MKYALLKPELNPSKGALILLRTNLRLNAHNCHNLAKRYHALLKVPLAGLKFQLQILTVILNFMRLYLMLSY